MDPKMIMWVVYVCSAAFLLLYLGLISYLQIKSMSTRLRAERDFIVKYLTVAWAALILLGLVPSALAVADVIPWWVCWAAIVPALLISVWADWRIRQSWKS